MSYLFAGATHKLESAQALSSLSGQSFTLACWVSVADATPASIAVPFSLGNASTSANNYVGLRLLSAGNASAQAYETQSSSVSTADGSTNARNDEWFLIVGGFTVNGSNQVTALDVWSWNGLAEAALASLTGLTRQMQSFNLNRIGMSRTGSGNVSGKVAHAAIWRRLLTGSERTQLSRYVPGLVARDALVEHWPLMTGAAATIGGASFDLTVTDASLVSGDGPSLSETFVPTWFLRLDAGLPTWNPVSAETQFGVSNDASAQYNVVAPVSADGAAVWSVITAGALGTINGAGVLPITAEQSGLASWNILSGVSRDQATTYQLITAAHRDQSATWEMLAAAASNAVAVWSVVSTLNRDGTALWQVLTAAQRDASPEWTVLGGVYADGSAEYAVETSPLTAANNAFAIWDVIADALADASPQWQVFESVDPADGVAEWHILLSAEADAEALWQVIEMPYADAQALYSIEGVAALVYGTLFHLPHRSEIEQRPHRSELVHTWPQ